MTDNDRNTLDELRLLLDQAKLRGTKEVTVPLDTFEGLLESALEHHDLVMDLDGHDPKDLWDKGLEVDELSEQVDSLTNALADSESECADLRETLGSLRMVVAKYEVLPC